MPVARVTFQKIVQDIEGYSSFKSDDSHMVSTLHFSVEVNGQRFDNLHVEVRQPFGVNYESEPLEIAEPNGHYVGGWDHSVFADLCEAYYRGAISLIGSGVQLSADAGLRMRGNIFVFPDVFEFNVPEKPSGRW